MTTNEDDIICHSQVTRPDGISVNLTEIERFLKSMIISNQYDRELINTH